MSIAGHSTAKRTVSVSAREASSWKGRATGEAEKGGAIRRVGGVEAAGDSRGVQSWRVGHRSLSEIAKGSQASTRHLELRPDSSEDLCVSILSLLSRAAALAL